MRWLAALLLLAASAAFAQPYNWDDGLTDWDGADGEVWDAVTHTPTQTNTPTVTDTPTQTPSGPTNTPTLTSTPTITPTQTPTGTLDTPTITPTPTITGTFTPSATAANTSTWTPTNTGNTATPTQTPTATFTPTGTAVSCVIGGTSTPYLLLCKPPHGYEDWDVPVNMNMDLIDGWAQDVAGATSLPAPQNDGEVPYANDSLTYETDTALRFRNRGLGRRAFTVNEDNNTNQQISFDISAGLHTSRYLRLDATNVGVGTTVVPMFFGQELTEGGITTDGRWTIATNSLPYASTPRGEFAFVRSWKLQMDDGFFRLQSGVDGLGTGYSTHFRIDPATFYAGVWTAAPTSAWTVPNGRYLQAANRGEGPPTSTDCDSSTEAGRQYIDVTNNRWYVCNENDVNPGRGWDYVELTN